MAIKPDWEKEYKINNCEVTGFCKLSDLKEDKYNRKQYVMSVLVDKDIAEKIKTEAVTANENLKEDYDCKVQEFGRITDILKKEKDENGKIKKKIKCPEGKMLINLATDSCDGEYVVFVYDAKRNPVENIKLCEGSIVNVHFRLHTFTNKEKTNGGISLKLQAVQIVKAVTSGLRNDLKQCPFDELDVEDEFVDEEDEAEEI